MRVRMAIPDVNFGSLLAHSMCLIYSPDDTNVSCSRGGDFEGVGQSGAESCQTVPKGALPIHLTEEYMPYC